jgi:hypothetical protein
MGMLSTVQFRRVLIFGMLAGFCLVLGRYASAGAAAPPDGRLVTSLDRGFVGLYNLDFAGALAALRNLSALTTQSHSSEIHWFVTVL